MSALYDATAPVSIFVFGDYHVRSSGKLATPPLNLLRVLVYVLLEGRGNPVSRGRIRDLIWSDNGSERANADIRQNMGRIRKFQQDYDFELLSADTQTVWLNPGQNIYIDLAEFLDLAASPSPKGCLRMCEIYHAELLVSPGSAGSGFEEWLALQRAALFGDFNKALSQALQDETGLTPQERRYCASRLLRLDPCHEGAHRSLMSDAAAKGQFSLVKQLYNACSKQLHDELGVGPDDATVRLYQELTGRSLND
ncbi:BTAD domain-containing putative transcriptional regulator [Devosia sp. 1566]|uniref:AfsR/SARP family transcriptional regulator n=1 Tax=Devosia sp. 1566 TaxID=2499144 RepID=UPI000FD964CF|nr:BTAD domain-containing putative transcriptional regulator [Devosia sp. 1566]